MRHPDCRLQQAFVIVKSLKEISRWRRKIKELKFENKTKTVNLFKIPKKCPGKKI